MASDMSLSPSREHVDRVQVDQQRLSDHCSGSRSDERRFNPTRGDRYDDRGVTVVPDELNVVIHGLSGLQAMFQQFLRQPAHRQLLPRRRSAPSCHTGRALVHLLILSVVTPNSAFTNLLILSVVILLVPVITLILHGCTF